MDLPPALHDALLFTVAGEAPPAFRDGAAL